MDSVAQITQGDGTQKKKKRTKRKKRQSAAVLEKRYQKMRRYHNERFQHALNVSDDLWQQQFKIQTGKDPHPYEPTIDELRPTELDEQAKITSWFLRQAEQEMEQDIDERIMVFDCFHECHDEDAVALGIFDLHVFTGSPLPLDLKPAFDDYHANGLNGTANEFFRRHNIYDPVYFNALQSMGYVVECSPIDSSVDEPEYRPVSPDPSTLELPSVRIYSTDDLEDFVKQGQTVTQASYSHSGFSGVSLPHRTARCTYHLSTVRYVGRHFQPVHEPNSYKPLMRFIPGRLPPARFVYVIRWRPTRVRIDMLCIRLHTSRELLVDHTMRVWLLDYT